MEVLKLINVAIRIKEGNNIRNNNEKIGQHEALHIIPANMVNH